MNQSELINHLATKKGSRRLYYIDNLRVLACFLVILTHSVMPATDASSEGIWMFTISFLGSPSSELFLALSGTVLLPVRTDSKTFYTKRFLKLLPPMIFWSIVGMFLYIPLHDYTLAQSLTKIIRIPLEPVIGVYWFVYVMIGLYLFAPIISAWLRDAQKRQLEMFLFIWSVTLIMPWFYMAIGEHFKQEGSHYWMLNYFGGFIGYWILGHYLNKYPIKISWNKKWIFLVLLSLSYPISIIFIKNNNIDTTDLLDNLQFGSAVLVAILYTVLQKIKFSNNIQSILTSIAKYSFGIYLIHFFTIRIIWRFFDNSNLHIFPRSFIIAVITIFICWMIIYIISKIPYGRYITGASK